ncbi:hypothetical protein K9M48_00150 [Candidatus Gracilibacteria bacterium]|nr:hypothetical protein [Candidatus Gracilibacteria bacterium]
MEKTYTKVTFKPLSGGRYRCNQTGVVLKKTKTQSYKRMLLNAGKVPEKEKIYNYRNSVNKGSRISCPQCHSSIRISNSSGIYRCSNDHRVNVTNVVEKQRQSFGFSWW